MAWDEALMEFDRWVWLCGPSFAGVCKDGFKLVLKATYVWDVGRLLLLIARVTGPVYLNTRKSIYT